MQRSWLINVASNQVSNSLPALPVVPVLHFDTSPHAGCVWFDFLHLFSLSWLNRRLCSSSVPLVRKIRFLFILLRSFQLCIKPSEWWCLFMKLKKQKTTATHNARLVYKFTLFLSCSCVSRFYFLVCFWICNNVYVQQFHYFIFFFTYKFTHTAYFHFHFSHTIMRETPYVFETSIFIFLSHFSIC